MAYSSRLELVIDSRNGERSLRRLEKALDDVESAGGDTSESVDEVNSELSRLNKVALAAAGALGALGVAFGADEIIRYSDAWTNTSNLLRQVTDTTTELTQAQRDLMGVANESRSSYESTVSLYTRLAKSTDQLGISDERLLKITESINKSFAVSGASAEEASGAIRQLAQGLAAGALRGDEFNSVSESAPEIMDAIAKSLGKTRGELRDFAAEGGVTAQIIIDAMEKAAESIDKTFADSAVSFGQKMEEANNNVLQFVGNTEEIGATVSLAGDGIVLLSDNIDTLIDGAGILAAVIAGRLTGSFATATAAQLAATQQSIAYQAALARMAGVSRTAATAQLAMGAAVRGASAAMALVGGPLGAAVLAAGAIYYFREALGLVPSPAITAAEAVHELSARVNGATDSMLKFEVAVFTSELIQLQIEAERTAESIAQMKETASQPYSFGQGQQGDLREALVKKESEEATTNNKIAAREQAIATLQSRIEALKASQSDNADVTRTVTLAVNDLTDAQKAAQREADNFGNSLQSLTDRLFPAEAAQRKFLQDQLALQTALVRGAAGLDQNTISLDNYAEATRRLNNERSVAITGGLMNQVDTGGLMQIDANQSGWDRWLESAQIAFTDFDAMAANTAESFQRGFGQAFESMVFDSQTFGGAMYNLFDGIARTLVRALGEMAAQWLAYQAVQLLVGSTTQASAAATQTANAQAMSVMAGLNAFSSTAAIPVVGPALAPAAMSAALAVTQPLAASVSALSYAGMFDKGGIIPAGQWGIAGERGPEIVHGPARVTSRKQTAEMMSSSPPSITVNTNVNVTAERGASQADAERQGRAAGQALKNTIIQVLQNEQRPGGLLNKR